MAADKLIYCHETIYLQNKLQDACWVEARCGGALVHGSDEDSDSDASDEEKDQDEIMYSPETLALLTQEIDCEWGTRHAGGCKCEWGMGVLV